MTTEQLIATEQAESDAQIVASNGDCTFTRGELRRYFEMVEDKTNWKNPIDKTVSGLQTRDLAGIIESVKFFAGCLAHCVDAKWDNDTQTLTVRFKAVGYYAAVGA